MYELSDLVLLDFDLSHKTVVHLKMKAVWFGNVVCFTCRDNGKRPKTWW